MVQVQERPEELDHHIQRQGWQHVYKSKNKEDAGKREDNVNSAKNT